MSVWLPLLLVTLLCALVRQLGARGGGNLSPITYQVGTIGLVVVCVLGFWLIGVVGLVIMAGVAWLVMPLLADFLLFPWLRRGSRTTFSDFRSCTPWRAGPKPPMTIEQLLSWGERGDAECAAIASRPDISTVLAAHGKDAEDIKRIEGDLMKIGLGARIPRKVVSDPSLLQEYYTLEADGVAGMRLFGLYLGWFGPPERGG